MERLQADLPKQAIVVDVGRSTLRIGLTDDMYELRSDTVRSFDAAAQPTVAGAITTFARDAGLSKLPRALGLSVAGQARGDTISVTHGRWRMSRSGLASMIRSEPLILNDFAAVAWAIANTRRQDHVEPLRGERVATDRPGTFCIIGVGTGLGVALLSRDQAGTTHVVSTEAGHSGFPSGLKDLEPVVAALSARGEQVTPEGLISASGITAIHAALAGAASIRTAAPDAREIVRRAGQHDRLSLAALTLCAKALWYFAGNLALLYGAWDGVIITGSVATAMRDILREPDLIETFNHPGPYKRQLGGIPCCLVNLANAELEGIAAALRARAAQQ